MAVKTARQQLIDYLETRRSASAADIQHALHMTGANARHHLNELERLGTVLVVGKKSTSGRGRPSLLYALARQAGRHHLDGLADGLLRAMAHLPDEQQTQMLLATAESIAKRATANTPSESRSSLGLRLAQTVACLNAIGYQSRWEARSGGPRLILGHCPYLAVLENHPNLCQMDAAVIEKLLGSAVSQTTKQEPTASGLAQCVFVVSG